MSLNNTVMPATEPGKNVFEAVTRHVQAVQSAGKRAIVALWSDGARERMSHVLRDQIMPLTSLWRLLLGLSIIAISWSR